MEARARRTDCWVNVVEPSTISTAGAEYLKLEETEETKAEIRILTFHFQDIGELFICFYFSRKNWNVAELL